MFSQPLAQRGLHEIDLDVHLQVGLRDRQQQHDQLWGHANLPLQRLPIQLLWASIVCLTLALQEPREQPPCWPLQEQVHHEQHSLAQALRDHRVPELLLVLALLLVQPRDHHA